MKSKIYITGILFALACTACKKNFLDTAPPYGLSSAKIFENDDNATMAVNGIYESAAQQAFNLRFGFIQDITNTGPDAYSYGRAAQSALSMGLATSRSGAFETIYEGLYRPIIYANDVIAGLQDNKNVTPELGSRLIGEAEFFRGLCYFYLWNLYGDVVLIDKPTPVSETFLPRTPVKEVQDFVIKDFTDAISRLPVSYPSTDLGRVTRGAAIAMLGKTYLYLQQWKEAEEQFAKLLNTPYNYGLTDNFGDNFYWQTQNNKESVFELQYEMETGLGSEFDDIFGNRSLGKMGEDYCEASTTALKVFTHRDGTPFNLSSIPERSDYSGSNAEVNYGKDLIHWYDTTFQDADVRLRQSMILPGDSMLGKNSTYYKVYWPYNNYINADPPALKTTWNTIGVIPIRKFLMLGDENILTNKDCATNFPMIRFADVLLMYAEATNEADGPIQGVYDAVNRVRNRAKVVDLTPGLSQDEMRRAIRLERYKELMFETHLYFDVKRWHLAHTTDSIFGLNRDVIDFRFDTLYHKAFREDRDYLWPIPGQEIDLNPKLTQNPNWN
jgi:hypothetical protein